MSHSLMYVLVTCLTITFACEPKTTSTSKATSKVTPESSNSTSTSTTATISDPCALCEAPLYLPLDQCIIYDPNPSIPVPNPEKFNDNGVCKFKYKCLDIHVKHESGDCSNVPLGSMGFLYCKDEKIYHEYLENNPIAYVRCE